MLGLFALFSGWAFGWQGGDTMCFFCCFSVFAVVVAAMPGIRLGLWGSFEIDKQNLTHPV